MGIRGDLRILRVDHGEQHQGNQGTEGERQCLI